MKVLILAGGLGTRLSEETEVRPKPMVEIGGRPILWHIMKGYAHFGYTDFVLLLGYKGFYIKEYFANYLLHNSNVTIDLARDRVEVLSTESEPWRVTLLDTGSETMTGGRIKRAAPHVGAETFMLTYGDGVSDVDLEALLSFHRRHGKALTMTSVRPDGRFGTFAAEPDDRVSMFLEKPRGDGAWINGGFFVCEPRLFEYLEGDATVLEREPMQRMAAEGELFTYRHDGFWKCMDTLRDKNDLNQMWQSGRAKWKRW